jgi:hypothetical protein
MFPKRFFARAYFAFRYWAQSIGLSPVVISAPDCQIIRVPVDPYMIMVDDESPNILVDYEPFTIKVRC